MKAKRLIVADSQRELLLGLSEALARDDYDVSQAVNGFQALQMARELQPDLLVIDDSLVGIGGAELCDRIKSDPQTRDILVVLLTDDPTLVFRTPADRCLRKPQDPQQIAREVEDLLR